MTPNLIRKLAKGKAPIWVLKLMGKVWGPYLGAGIDVIDVSPDYRQIKVCLKKRWYNSNYVGTQFGGSIYAMTDPFYMLMLMNNLGRDYIVWDKAASIRFRKPGKTDLYATFELSDEEIEGIRKRLETEPKLDFEKDVIVTDASGETVAEIHKVVYVKKKDRPAAAN